MDNFFRSPAASLGTNRLAKLFTASAPNSFYARANEVIPPFSHRARDSNIDETSLSFKRLSSKKIFLRVVGTRLLREVAKGPALLVFNL